MSRNIGQIDKDLATTEGLVKGLKTALGNTSSGNSGNIDVAARLTRLEVGSGEINKRLGGIDSSIDGLGQNIKNLRWLVLGVTASAQLIKLDIQAVKLDYTAWKFDEKGRSEAPWVRRIRRSIMDLFDRDAKRDRLRAETEAREKADKLKKTMEGLPKRVGDAEKDIDKIRKALQNARDKADTARNSRTGLPANHKGVDAKDPRIGPVTKDVKNLRSAVDGLVSALGGL